MNLSITDAHVTLDGQPVVQGVNLNVPPGSVVGLIGPNGSGKSTLLRAVYRVLRPSAGIIRLGEADVWQLPHAQVARQLAVVTQDSQHDFDFTVQEVVEMGRTPHLTPFRRSRQGDRDVVQDALRRVGATHLAARHLATLSGGERQRVLVARALAQQPSVLLFDEPTNHLDIRFQLELFELIRSLGITTLVTLHDLTLAARYCHSLHLLHRGEVVASGSPQDVLTPEHILRVYGVQAEVRRHPVTHALHLDFSPVPARQVPSGTP